VPEGDTIHKIARFLAPRLEGRTIRAVDMADPAAAKRCAGREVRAVRARGKHLYIALDNALALRSHLGMHGAWHFYAPGADWRKPRRQASLVVTTDTECFVCFNAKEVELVADPSVRRRVLDTRLGPDLVDDAVAPDELVRRARAMMDPQDLVGDVLLDQRVAAGIGNVYKSEVLFVERVSPFSRLGDLADRRLAACYATAADLLRRNLGGGRRVTRFERDGAGRLWVYRREGMPCLRCDGRIEAKRLGRHHRGTYWCPRCQPLQASDQAERNGA